MRRENDPPPADQPASARRQTRADHDGAKREGAEHDRAERGGAERARYARGLPDHHDPLGGFGGAPPAQSALTLRLVLATFGVLVTGGGAIAVAVVGGPLGYVIVLAILAVIALVDVAVIVRRKRRGEPG